MANEGGSFEGGKKVSETKVKVGGNQNPVDFRDQEKKVVKDQPLSQKVNDKKEVESS